MEDLAGAGPSFSKRLRYSWQTARQWLILVAAIVGSVLVLSLPISERQTSFALAVNDVAPQDIAAPYTLTYTSDVLTREAQEAAAAAVPDVYDPPDSRVAREQLDRLQAALDFIDSVRLDSHSSTDQRLADLASLADLRLSADTAQAILNLPDPRWQAVKLEAISVFEQVMRGEIRDGEAPAARRTVPALVSMSIPESQATIVAELVAAFVAPNAHYNDTATIKARDEAMRAVAPVQKTYLPGETIVARGQLVSDLQLEALNAYGLLKTPRPWLEIAEHFLLITVLAFTFALFAYRVHPQQILTPRISLTLSILFILEVLGMQFTIPGRALLPYAFPGATLPMLVTILFGPGLGVLMSMVTGAVAGYLAPRGLELALYVMLAGTMASLVIGRAERLASFFWAGLGATLASVAVIVVFRFPDPATDLLGKASLVAAGMLGGLFSASLAFGLTLLIGNLIGITTNLQLIELSRPDHPLLQLILHNAPGTYQHSLQVANLAEQAARAVYANPLLTRVGALYHDAGKALRPQFFIENQISGQNVHKQLDPTTSASVILSHVHDGLDLARKYRLPRAIRDFIPQHHGTLEASFQFQAAVDAAGGDETRVNRRDFTYPGPRPRTREAAILMLADGVEAKARADNPTDDEAIESLVRWVIDDRLDKGQLDRTDLTLKDLDTIRRVFISTLKGIYHPRIRYPETHQEGQTILEPALAPRGEKT
jgi:putative nucleotidyltransferase with HDIG domain